MSSRNGKRAVFDASAVLALLQGEPGSAQLQEMQPDAIVSAVNAAEVLAKLVRRGIPLNEARAALDALHLEIAPFDSAMAAISATYVSKGISLGDRCFLAAARRLGSGWTSARDLAKLPGGGARLHFFRR